MSENVAVAEPVKVQDNGVPASTTTTETAAASTAAKSSNVKSDASVLPESSDPAEILKQVEFYFSNENLPNDKFLYKLSLKNEGWVPIATICMFARMKRFRPVSAVVEALRGSKELLEVSEDGELVRRKIPLVEPKKEEKQDAFARSIYAKGFGEETATSQFDIEKFFETFGKFKQVRLRRDNDKKFKSSVFVEFASLEDAEKFLALDPKPKYNDVELLTMSKQAYVDMKAAEHGFTAHASGKNYRKFNAFKDDVHNNKKRRGGDNNNRNRNDNKRRRGPNDRNRERENKDKENKTTEDTQPSTDAAPSTEPATESAPAPAPVETAAEN
ncbi:Lhp1p [Sugiyamaella lignohabitans]|uniref:Lhp1p n=1 Tax=Sugiyamaella lignohabitans TaxID=796027 RepID=A0A167EQA2_9ASCO|nr:Lhp1p [Sugiyamaella lignohabitans]ANB14339.1 Lhp1p [Sugiyamaella lignohabitans]